MLGYCPTKEKTEDMLMKGLSLEPFSNLGKLLKSLNRLNIVPASEECWTDTLLTSC